MLPYSILNLIKVDITYLRTVILTASTVGDLRKDKYTNATPVSLQVIDLENASQLPMQLATDNILL